MSGIRKVERVTTTVSIAGSEIKFTGDPAWLEYIQEIREKAEQLSSSLSEEEVVKKIESAMVELLSPFIDLMRNGSWRVWQRKYGKEWLRENVIAPAAELLKTYASLYTNGNVTAAVAEMMNLHSKKNSDYTGKDADALSNILAIVRLAQKKPFFLTLQEAAVLAGIGLVARMSDKYSRLEALFVKKHKPEVKDETARDTFRDWIVYAGLYCALMRRLTKR